MFDIPNTAKSALQGILNLKPEFTTLHISGGSEMIRDCVNIKNSNQSKTNLIGVTVLTSFDEVRIKEVGIHNSINDQVLILAKLANENNLDGIVCSPQEIKRIKQETENKLKLIVPGIRNIDDNNDKKKRTNDTKEINKGGENIVIGRRLTRTKENGEAVYKELKK